MATVRVDVQPEMFRWARERARLSLAVLEQAFPRLPEWERQEAKPTLKQLERFAKRTRAPIGYFFLTEPPEEQLPIPDFRTIRDLPVAQPSPDLLDTIYMCQMRQDWYREHMEATGQDPLVFVGSMEARGEVVVTAAAIREAFALDRARQAGGSWEDALRELVRAIEDRGVLVMRNGVVGNNTHRPLDVREFRGFALSDPLAPLIFVNAKDSKAGQLFTLAHELVHIVVGRSGVSDQSPRTLPQREPDLRVERWCNEVAAEILVPLDIFSDDYRRGAELADEMRRLSRRFKVSTLVVLRRMFDAGGLGRDEMWSAYDAELERLRRLGAGRKSDGGDFHATEAVRVSPRFARALIQSTLEGTTLYRDAFHMLGIRKEKTFRDFGAELDLVL